MRLSICEEVPKHADDIEHVELCGKEISDLGIEQIFRYYPIERQIIKVDRRGRARVVVAGFDGFFLVVGRVNGILLEKGGTATTPKMSMETTHDKDGTTMTFSPLNYGKKAQLCA